MTSARDSAPEVREPAATRPRARVLYLHQYFVTRATAGGTRSYEMARRLVARGYQVHMITTDFGADAQPGAGWRVTDEDGICVHRVRVPYSNRAGFIGRLRAFLRYALASTVRVWALGGDVILATSPPLSIAIPALLGAWRHDIPMIFEVRDLWPEAPVAMGRLRNPALIAAARGLERLAYRRAAAIVGLSPPIAEGVARAGGDGAKVRVIPNAADIDLFDGTRDVAALRRALGLDGALTLGYFGTLGEANALGQVLDAAARLRARGEGGIRFLLVGDGGERDALARRIADEGLDSVTLRGPVAKEEIADYVAAVDACMVILKNVPAIHTGSPNKLFDALAGGRPVLTNVGGWQRRLLEEAACGLYFEPDNPDAFADAALRLRDDPALRAAMGRRGRALAEQRFARDALAGQLADVIAATLAAGGSFTRPCGGAVRLNRRRLDAAALARDLAQLPADAWRTLDYQKARSSTSDDHAVWSRVVLVEQRGGGVWKNPVLKDMPAIADALARLPGPVMAAVLARLEPGGVIGEHRDLSGGSSLGVARFHAPIVTHEDVEFFVDGVRVRMAAGEVWSLDTTYPHRLANHSSVGRVHLIVDVRRTAAIRAMLPRPGLRDAAHLVEFAGVCATHAARLARRDPRQLARRVRDALGLRLRGRSALRLSDEEPR